MNTFNEDQARGLLVNVLKSGDLVSLVNTAEDGSKVAADHEAEASRLMATMPKSPPHKKVVGKQTARVAPHSQRGARGG